APAGDVEVDGSGRQPEIDLKFRDLFGGPEPYVVLVEFAREEFLRQGRAVVRQFRLGIDHRQGAVEAGGAQRLRSAGTRDPGPDDDNALPCGHAGITRPWRGEF